MPPLKISKKLAALAIAVLFAAGCTPQAAPRETNGMDTPKKVELTKYTGLWYEIARTPNGYQDNRPTREGRTWSACAGSTATYTLIDDDAIHLKNQCVRTAPDGSTFVDVATGVANIVSNSGGRKLKIAFGPAIARFFQRLISLGGFNYWIIDIGESATDAPYTWAIVSGPKRDFLYFLTRKRNPSPAIMNRMLSSAQKAGLPVNDLVYAQ